MHRLYENEDISVFWDAEKCRHARKCVTGSPAVFDFQRKPWIDISKAPNAEIWDTVSKCPTGALTILYNNGISVRLEEGDLRSVALNGEQIIGECDYQETEEEVRITHTEVLPEYGGKGIAKRLVYKVVEAAEKSHKRVVPYCSYAAKLLG
ncbi:MAG: GNAT family N-acetyltransferase [Lachnospiraceae bacterium]|nr:GNAT family N-acetyltransferase [Lachnospiraceae bacterium]